jgi:hypothetical protein
MDESGQKPKTPQINRLKLINLAMELGFIIALPLVAFGLGGKWLDQRFGTEPWLTLIAIAVAITTTTIWLIRRLKEMIK